MRGRIVTYTAADNIYRNLRKTLIPWDCYFLMQRPDFPVAGIDNSIILNFWVPKENGLKTFDRSPHHYKDVP